MEEEIEVPDVPQIEKSTDEEEDITTEKSDKQISDTISTVTRKIKETINIELFLPDIHNWIFERLKIGSTLIIGEKIVSFAEEIAKVSPSVVARDTSPEYVRLKRKGKDAEVLRKLDFKKYSYKKFKTQEGPFYNIIVIFALKHMSKEDRLEFLEKCKRILAKDGQLIVVGEFYPKSALLYPITLTKEGFKTIKSKIFQKKITRPISGFDKLVDKIQLKFYDVKYDAGGRIRSYILTKRWGALLN